jgi:hypothetical protein
MKIKIEVLLIVVFTVFTLAIALAGCGGGGDIGEVKSQSYSVDFTGVNPSDSGTTYGEAIENYCPGGKWKQFTGNTGDNIVEYNGGDSPEGSTSIQWMKKSSGWSVWAMEIEDKGLSQAHINTFFSAAQQSRLIGDDKTPTTGGSNGKWIRKELKPKLLNGKGISYETNKKWSGSADDDEAIYQVDIDDDGEYDYRISIFTYGNDDSWNKCLDSGWSDDYHQEDWSQDSFQGFRIDSEDKCLSLVFFELNEEIICVSYSTDKKAEYINSATEDFNRVLSSLKKVNKDKVF